MANRSVLAGDPFAYAGSKLPEYSTRVQRALALVEEHSDEIEALAGDVYIVPSQDGRRVYRVLYGEREFCSCPDNTYRGVNCVHILAVGIASAKGRAKMASCDGCGRRFPLRDLIELDEDNHDGLTYFDGDRLCGECTDDAGVIR